MAASAQQEKPEKKKGPRGNITFYMIKQKKILTLKKIITYGFYKYLCGESVGRQCEESGEIPENRKAVWPNGCLFRITICNNNKKINYDLEELFRKNEWRFIFPSREHPCAVK
jgi:hypothetical protein